MGKGQKLIGNLSKVLLIILFLGISTPLSGCARRVTDDEQEWQQRVSENLVQKGVIRKVGVVLSSGDAFMNQTVVNSLTGLAANQEVELKVLQPGELPLTKDAVRYLAENNYQMIIGLPTDYPQVVTELQDTYPEVTFVTIDNEIEGKNTLSLVFKEEEGGFLAGVMAAMVNKTGVVGYLGGKADDPQALAYRAGFYQGVKYVNGKFKKDIRVNSKFVGYFDKDVKPEKAKAIAVQQYAYGADIIFQAAGVASEGVLQAAEQRGGLIIGSEVNQNWKVPGLIPASVIKNFDVIIKNIVNQVAQGKSPKGILIYSLKNNGIRLTDMRNIESVERVGVKHKQPALDKIIKIKSWVPDEVLMELQQVRIAIGQGEIKVSDQVSEEYMKSLAPLPTPVPPDTSVKTSPGKKKTKTRNSSSDSQKVKQGAVEPNVPPSVTPDVTPNANNNVNSQATEPPLSQTTQ